MNDILKDYIKYLDKKKNDPNYDPSIDKDDAEKIAENTAIYNISHDPKYANLYRKVVGIGDYDAKKAAVADYMVEEEYKDADTKELLGKVFGVNIEELDNVKLSNGVEIFGFYDKRLGRKRLLENISRDSLIKQLKDKQSNNEIFQTDDYKKNSTDILQNQVLNNNNRQELKMVEIDEYINHPENFGTLDEDTRDIINKLLGSKESMKIKYFNIQNRVALTKDNTIIEITKDKEGRFVIDKPTKFNNTVNEASNESEVRGETVSTGYDLNSTNEKYSIESDNIKDQTEYITDEEIEEEFKINNVEMDETMAEIKENVKIYYEDPTKMDKINDPAKKEVYEKLVNEIYAVRKEEELKKEQTKSMVYTNPDLNTNGFVNLLFISILLLFFAFILFLSF